MDAPSVETLAAVFKAYDVRGTVPDQIDDDLARAVGGLLADPAERERLGAAGRQYVERHFRWSQSVARLDAALHRATASAPDARPAPAPAVLAATTGARRP